MKRRNFIKNLALSTGSLLIADNLLAETLLPPKSKKLVILHTNDTHSNIDSFPSNHPKFPGMGDVAKRFTLIQKIRSENEHVLLLDSGDIFQGTPYFNTFNGELEMKLMSKLGYDAATMGNHDFDIGLEGFMNAKKHANFPFVCSNYNFSKTVLANETKLYHIFKKGGIKIGVFGIGVELNGLVPKDKYGETLYKDPIETANSMAQLLTDLGCKVIICLSHLGYDYEDKARISDLVLAKETANIHLILGGHTHTFLDKPTVLNNANNQQVLINQVGWAGVNLGRIDIDIDKGILKSSTLEVK
ncbi:MAG: bifunctional metallophosphatase/5'-nucleotidase [Flavobacteriales bacterium]|nr:bifunctional metallophosphatase/5'-nucleotidase [Flavobacteriales bacterium]